MREMAAGQRPIVIQRPGYAYGDLLLSKSYHTVSGRDGCARSLLLEYCFHRSERGAIVGKKFSGISIFGKHPAFFNELAVFFPLACDFLHSMEFTVFLNPLAETIPCCALIDQSRLRHPNHLS